MTDESAIQAQLERDLTWKRLWPRSFLAIAAVVQIALGLVESFFEM